MPKKQNNPTVIGIDIGKNNFHLIGLGGSGEIVLRRKLSRRQKLSKAGLMQSVAEMKVGDLLDLLSSADQLPSDASSTNAEGAE